VSQSREGTELYYDPYSDEIDRDPHPVWKRLRDEAPVYRNDDFDFYALSRYDDVLNACLDTETFSSAHGIVLEVMTDELFPLPGMLIFMDPPTHTALRKVANRAFTARALAKIEGRVNQVCGELLDPHVGSDGFDYVAAFGNLLPPTMILSLLGFPDGHADEWRKAMTKGFSAAATETTETPAVDAFVYGMQHQESVFELLPQLCDERRREPQEDLISVLVQSEIPSDTGGVRRLTDEEISTFVHMLAVAGSDTVAKLLGWAAVLLARHPQQRRLLVEQPDQIGNAVEEILRYEAPSPVNARWVTRDVELHGQMVKAGSKLLLLNGSADRDERHFPDPDRFDVTRQIDRHLAFGYGAHFCIGQALARLEGRVALRETLRRWPSWIVDEDDLMLVPRNGSSAIRGFQNVPVRLPTKPS